jgi:hypothetical protein
VSGRGRSGHRFAIIVDVEAADEQRAVAATIAIAAGLGLEVDDAVVVVSSNKLAVRLLPCDVHARVAHEGKHIAALEIEVAQRLTAAGGPVAALEPRVPPRIYERDGLALTLWTSYESVSTAVPPAEYARALAQLHVGLRTIDVATPHFTDRVAEAAGHIASTSVLDDADRELVGSTLQRLERAITDRGAPEQLLHGEPHPGNVLSTRHGPLFIDLETLCRGPVEFDLAHAPAAVGEHYPGVDRDLLRDCQGLVLAIVAGWRCEPDDGLPNREERLRELLVALRAGPPWPTLDRLARSPSP